MTRRVRPPGARRWAPRRSRRSTRSTCRTRTRASSRTRGFLAANAPEGTQLGGAIRAFQKSEGLPQTGYPDDETLRQLGIDPRTKDRTLDPAPVWREGTTGAGVSH